MASKSGATGLSAVQVAITTIIAEHVAALVDEEENGAITHDDCDQTCALSLQFMLLFFCMLLLYKIFAQPKERLLTLFWQFLSDGKAL